MANRLYLRNAVWWIWYYRDGKQVRESTKCTDRKAALEVLKRRERQTEGIGPQRFTSLGSILTNLETWISARRKAGTLSFVKEKSKALKDVLGEDTDVHGLTRADLESYIVKRSEPVELTTIKKELGVLYQAIRKAGLRVDVAKLRPEIEAPYVPRKVWLTKEEFSDLADELEPDRYRWVCVAVYTGARDSEVEGLTWGDVKEGEVHIRGTKTPESDRHIPLHPKLEEVLGKRRAGPLVRPWENVCRDLAVACKNAGVPRVTPNDLRRTFASWLLQAGVSNSVVAKLLGHTTTALVDKTYGKLAKGTLREAMEKI